MGTRVARHSIAVGLLLLLLSAGVQPAAAASVEAGSRGPEPPNISGSAGVVIDSTGAAPSGRVLWEKASGEQRSIASLTKIVTALVVVDRAQLDDEVTSSAEAENIGATDPLVTELELRAGEKMSVRNLLYGLLLISANDAAVALAEHVGGSTESFVALMNRKATELGATQTRFRNPHGFDLEGHYSTALDLSRFAISLMANDELREMVGRKRYEIRRASGVTTTLDNRNLLLGSFEGTNGVKTGQTRASGKALVASANRGGESRIAVVLGSLDAFADASSLLDYGFNEFRRFKVTRAGLTWGYATFGDGRTIRLVPRSDASYLVRAEEPDPKVRYDSRRRLLDVSFSTRDSPPKSIHLTEHCVESCKSHGSHALAWVWELLSPIARVLQSR